MAGPVQGNTRTRIIGLGYKPRSHNVDLKWGVLDTNVIHKEEVTEYIHSRHAFENMIEGSEELKAYIYEAQRFPRVDLPMIENNPYHSIYMNSPRLHKWNRTHGGPYYVEVGKNQKVEYTRKETVLINTLFNATTNETTKLYGEQNVTKTWIYYDYEPSNVEYYYYKDCIIKDMQPHSGLLTGGTLV